MQEAGIDLAPDAGVFEADALDHALFQLAHCDAAAEIGHVCRGRVWVDRAADQGQRARLCFWLFFGEVGGGGQGQRRGLADGDNMGVWPEVFHEINEVEGVILDVEFPSGDRNVARIVPIGDVDFAIDDERFDR